MSANLPEPIPGGRAWIAENGDLMNQFNQVVTEKEWLKLRHVDAVDRGVDALMKSLNRR